MMTNKKPNYKYCVVPRCQSTSTRTPDKTFISLPSGSTRNLKKRKLWMKAMKRNDLAESTRGVVCEDHFNLEEDAKNYLRFKLMGGSIFLKDDVVPHIFDCQISGYTCEKFAKTGKKHLMNTPSNNDNNLAVCAKSEVWDVNNKTIVSFIKEESSDLLAANMEHEDKFNIEETSLNLSSVKKEHEELELEGKKDCSILQRNNTHSLIGCLDDDVIMETESVKLEDVKNENSDITQETIEQFHCNRCGGNYDGYCPSCSYLSHILNNITRNLNLDPHLNAIPINLLEIRKVSTRQAIFALKTIPKGVILGPFDGVSPIESTNSLRWKIKNGKFVNGQNANWMKYIESVATPSLKNLDIFQFDGILYFETSREIQEGEELLVCYDVAEDVLKSDKKEEFYLVPVKKEEFPKVFACTFCHLGFGLENCLMEHKSKCPQGNHAGNLEDFEIIQCRCCKVWLEAKEHMENHMLYCLENNNRLRRILPNYRRTNVDGDEEVNRKNELTRSINADACNSSTTDIVGSDNCSYKISGKNSKITSSNTSKTTYNSAECSFQTNDQDTLKIHPSKHVKPIECDICKNRFTSKYNLKLHIITQHSNTTDKKYKCSECSYETNRKDLLKLHLNRHIVPFECDICQQRFSCKNYLQWHIKDVHLKRNEKEYKCPKCSYETNYKRNFMLHLNRHNDVKPFECEFCKKGFNAKTPLKFHVKNHHSNTSEKDYKCSKCSYQTNRKHSLKLHLTTHIDIKQFECDICKKKFTMKQNLLKHVQYIHTNSTEKKFKCSECSYGTNYKKNLMQHINIHNNVKPFECDFCKKRFNGKTLLKFHVKNNHSNTSEKEYKCPNCSFQTNYKNSLKLHLSTHDVESFECDQCNKRFNHQSTLKSHLKDKHLDRSDTEYKCSECSYQTHYKKCLQAHLNKHKNIKPFECDLCKKKFCEKGSLKTHIKNIHIHSGVTDFYINNQKFS